MCLDKFRATKQNNLLRMSSIYKLVAASKSLCTNSIPPYLSIFYISKASPSSIMYLRLMFERIGKWIWPIYLSFLLAKKSSMYLKVTLSISSIYSGRSSDLSSSIFFLSLPENLDNNASLIWKLPPSFVLTVLILLGDVKDGFIYLSVVYIFFLGPMFYMIDQSNI